MLRILTAVSFLALTTACMQDQPFDFTANGTDSDGSGTDGADGSGTDGTGGETGDADGAGTGDIDTGSGLPPGTSEPTSNGDIARFEARNDTGGGLVSSVAYNADNDTITVDNLAFDGANVYSRDSQVASLGGYAIYEADEVTFDTLTGEPIQQVRNYRTIFGVSDNTTEDGDPRTSFALVRSGGFAGYGFGGFVYERNGGVTIPVRGQAGFSGRYAGVRLFSNRGGLEYTRGDVALAIDFRDFNANDGVIGRITNREAFDATGAEIRTDGAGALQLPTLGLILVEGEPTLTPNGEMSGTLVSSFVDEEGVVQNYENGEFYGILSGDATDINDGGEIVGVFVIESEDTRPEFEGTSVQETGGFILTR